MRVAATKLRGVQINLHYKVTRKVPQRIFAGTQGRDFIISLYQQIRVHKKSGFAKALLNR